MTPREGYVAYSAKGSEDFMRDAKGIMPNEVSNNISRFFQKAKELASKNKTEELEEVPEGAF